MDREALRKAAESRRNEIVPERVVTWHCGFCLRDFATETGFMKHRCPERERLEEMRSPRGSLAYAYYSEWMRLQKRSVPDVDRFMTSRQYNYFMKFVDWVEKTSMPNPNQFIKLMVETGTQPVLWCRDNTYAMYLQWYDNAYPPSEQFIETFERLQMLAADHNVELSKVFNELGPQAVAKMVRRRKLSPWLLVLSAVFLDWLRSLPDTDKDMVADAVNFAAWSLKLRNEAELVRELKTACEEFGL